MMRKSSVSKFVQMDQHKLVQVPARFRKKKNAILGVLTGVVSATKSPMIKSVNMAWVECLYLLLDSIGLDIYCLSLVVIALLKWWFKESLGNVSGLQFGLY